MIIFVQANSIFLIGDLKLKRNLSSIKYNLQFASYACHHYALTFETKQEANETHGTPEKPVQISKHICTKLEKYHIVDLERRKTIISFFKIKWSFVKARLLFNQVCFMPSLVEIDLMVLQKKSFRLFHSISVFSYLSPLGKGYGPSFKRT